MTTVQWADSHRDLVAKFAQVMAKTATWANDHHDLSAGILTKYVKLDPMVARTMSRVRYSPRFVPGDMQPVIDLAAHYGTLPTPPIAADQLVYKI